MPSPPKGIDQPEDDEARMEREQKELQERTLQMDEQQQREEAEFLERQKQKAARKVAAEAKCKSEGDNANDDLAAVQLAGTSAVTRRQQIAGEVPTVEQVNTELLATTRDLRAALQQSREFSALQTQMRNLESRLFQAEGYTGAEAEASPSVRGAAPTNYPRSEAPPPPLHGTAPAPFVDEELDNPDEFAERATRRLLVPPLTPFTGVRSTAPGADDQPFSNWIKSFEQEMTTARIDRTGWLKTLRLFLKDAAVTVYDSRINCLPHDRRTYQGMVEVLRHTYDRCVTEREAQRGLCNLHWDPKACTIDEFYAKVEKIAANAYPQFGEIERQRLVTRQFIEAMPPSIQRQIDTRIDLSPLPQMAQSFQVLDWAREITRQEEKYFESTRAYRIALENGRRNSDSPSAQGDGEAVQRLMVTLSERGRGWRGRRGNWRGRGRGGGRGRGDFRQNSNWGNATFTNTNLQASTHDSVPAASGGFVNNRGDRGGRGGPSFRGQPSRGGAPQPRGGGRPYRDVSEIACFNCNQKGHYARDCTQPPTINTKLIQENVRMISAVARTAQRQGPQRKDGQVMAENAAKAQKMQPHRVKTVLEEEQTLRRKRNRKKKPSPPQQQTSAPKERKPAAEVQQQTSAPKERKPTTEKPAPEEHEPADLFQECPSQPTEQEPTAEKLASAVHEPAAALTDTTKKAYTHASVPVAYGAVLCNDGEETPTTEKPVPTEQKPAVKFQIESSTPEEQEVTTEKPAPKEQKPAVKFQIESSTPEEQEVTTEKPMPEGQKSENSLVFAHLQAYTHDSVPVATGGESNDDGGDSNRPPSAADERSEPDASSAVPDVQTVHRVVPGKKRNRLKNRRNRSLRTKIDPTSGECQKEAVNAPATKPYKETRLMTIPVSLNGRKSSAQIDTGSPISLVGRRPILCLIARFGRDTVSRMIKPMPKNYYDYSGNAIQLKGIISLDLKLLGTRVKFDAFLDATSDRDLILGMDLLSRMGCALRLFTDGGLTDLIISKPQKDGKSIVTLSGGGRDITSTMVMAEQKYQQRKTDLLDNQRSRTSDGSPPKQRRYDAVKVITLEPRTRQFVYCKLANAPLRSEEGYLCPVVHVEESFDGVDSEGIRIPAQLVEQEDGCAWLEVRNEDDAPRELHLNQLQVEVDTTYTLQPPWTGHADWVMRVPECGLTDLFGNSEPRVAQLQTYDDPMYLDGLVHTRLEDRKAELSRTLDIGDASEDLTEEQREQLRQLLFRNHDVLALTDDELGCCTLPEHAHAIDTGDSPPIAQPLRRLAMTKQVEVRKTLNTMKRTGVIQSSCSPWSSPIVPVWKKDGSMRITVDYRRLNEVTKKDRYPLSRCDELIDSMGLERPRYFTTLDLVQGFHQIRDDAIEKTAFSCQEGHFEYLRMPMGLTNSPASFQRLQNEILKGTDQKKVKVYLDDVAIATNTFQDHLLQLGIVFARFRKAGLRVKVQKCKFLKRELVYLGFEISKRGIRPNPARIVDVLNFKPPTTVKMVRQFVGLCSFYRRFVPNFAKIARPLTNLTRKDQGWMWGEEQAKAFQMLKDLLTSEQILAYPQWGKPYYILCDASAQGLGAILHQKDDEGRYRPIAYASRATDKNEQKYGASELECLCLVWALQHFHYYIWGQEIFVESDHQPLTCLNSKQTLPPRLERWNSIIIPYAPKIIYRRGRENEPADALSRYQRLAGTATESALDSVKVIKNRPDPDVDLEKVEKDVRERQRQLQLNDPFWFRLINAKESIKGGGPTSRMMAKMAERYRLQDGVLYFVGNDLEATPRLCVPQVERKAMIERYHEQRGVGAHLGAEKVYMAIAAGHFWPTMRTHIEQYCRECRVCLEQRGSAPRHKPPLSPIKAEAQPFVQVQIDVMNLPKTKKGNKKVLGIVDSFTGYLIYVPMKNEEATTVARKLHKHLFLRFAAPKRILSDNGPNFHSHVISELNKRFGIVHNFTTTFTPHSNGKTEKANSTMRQMLAKMTQDHPDDWDELIPDVMWAYNTTPVPTTGYSPHFLVFGSNPAVASASVFDWPSLGERLDYDDYMLKVERRRVEALKIAAANRSATQEQQKVRYDKKATQTSLVLGEHVMVYRPNLKTDKLKPKYDGPYELVWLSDTVAKVRRLVDGVIETHNLDKLSRCPPTVQVTNKHRPNKPRKYQKGKKKNTLEAQKPPEVKRIDWVFQERLNLDNHWNDLPPNPVVPPSMSRHIGRPMAYIQPLGYYTPSSSSDDGGDNYGEIVLMMRGNHDIHRSLRCLFCDEFVCVCDDDPAQQLIFDESEQSSALTSNTMADNPFNLNLRLGVDEELDYNDYEEQMDEDEVLGMVGEHQQSLGPQHAPGEPAGSPVGAAGASTSTTIKVREGDFGSPLVSDDEEEAAKAAKYPDAKRIADAQNAKLIICDDDSEEEEPDDDFVPLTDAMKQSREMEEYYDDLDSDEDWYMRKSTGQRVKRKNTSEGQKEAKRKARNRKQQARIDAINAGLPDPEEQRVDRLLSTVKPRVVGQKVQLAQRSDQFQVTGRRPVRPQVAVLGGEPAPPPDFQMAEDVEMKSRSELKAGTQELLEEIESRGISGAMRTTVEMAPSARHAHLAPGQLAERGFTEIEQSAAQRIMTSTCFVTPQQEDQLSDVMVKILVGEGASMVVPDPEGNVDDPLILNREQPLWTSTMMNVIGADKTTLQRSYDEVFNSTLPPDAPPHHRRYATRPIDNTAVFFNGRMATINGGEVLRQKDRDPERSLLQANAVVVQEVPAAGPLSDASVLVESLACQSPGYRDRVMQELEEPTLEDITKDMTKYGTMSEEDYAETKRYHHEMFRVRKTEVIQRFQGLDTSANIAISMGQPVKAARAAAEAAARKWTRDDPVELQRMRDDEEDRQHATRKSYDSIRRVVTRESEAAETMEVDPPPTVPTDRAPGAGVAADIIQMLAQENLFGGRRLTAGGDRDGGGNPGGSSEPPSTDVVSTAGARHTPRRRAGSLRSKRRQLTEPGQDPETSHEYQRAVKRLDFYNTGLDREGEHLPRLEAGIHRTLHWTNVAASGYEIVSEVDDETGLEVYFEQVQVGSLQQVYADFPDTEQERKDILAEFLVTDLAMRQYNQGTDKFNNDEYREKFFEMVNPGDFVSPITRAVFGRNLLMPRGVRQEEPPVVVNRAWQLLSERADRRCTQFRTPSTPNANTTKEDEKEWAACAYSYDQAGSILRSHFLQDYKTEPVMRYVHHPAELPPALDWLLRKPNLSGIVKGTDVCFLGWDLENGSSGAPWRDWRQQIKGIYWTTPAAQHMNGPFPILLTLANCWGLTLVIDLRYTRGGRPDEKVISGMPKPVAALLEDESVFFVCHDFQAENISWKNGYGKELKKERFIDLQEVGEAQLRRCGNDVLYTIAEGKRKPARLGLGKAIWAFTGDFKTAKEKAGFLKQLNPLNRENPSTKYLKMPEALVGNVCDMRYAAKDSIFALFLTMRVCLVDFYTQRTYRLQHEATTTRTAKKRHVVPPKTGYHRMIDWTKQIASVEPSKFYQRYTETSLTGGEDLPWQVNRVMTGVGRRLAQDLMTMEEKRDDDDTTMRLHLPYLYQITIGTNAAGEILNPRDDLPDMRTRTVTETNALPPREWLSQHHIIPVPSCHEWAQQAISNALQVAMRFIDNEMYLHGDAHRSAMLQGLVAMWTAFNEKWQRRYSDKQGEPQIKKQLEFEHAAIALRLQTPDWIRQMMLKTVSDSTRLLAAIPGAQQSNTQLLRYLQQTLEKSASRSERQWLGKQGARKRNEMLADLARETGQQVHRGSLLTLSTVQKAAEIEKGEMRPRSQSVDVQQRRDVRVKEGMSTARPEGWLPRVHHPPSHRSRAEAPDGAGGVHTRASSASAQRQQQQVRFVHPPGRRREQPTDSDEDMDGTYRHDSQRECRPRRKFRTTPHPSKGVTAAQQQPPSKVASMRSSQEAGFTSGGAVYGSSSFQVEPTTEEEPEGEASPQAKYFDSLKSLYPETQALSEEMKSDGRLYQLLRLGIDHWYALWDFVGAEREIYTKERQIARQILQEMGETQLTETEAKRAIVAYLERQMPPPVSSRPLSAGPPLTHRGAGRGMLSRPLQEPRQQPPKLPKISGNPRAGVYSSPYGPQIRTSSFSDRLVTEEPFMIGRTLTRVGDDQQIEPGLDRKGRLGMQTDYLVSPQTALCELALKRVQQLRNHEQNAEDLLSQRVGEPEVNDRLKAYIADISKRAELSAQVAEEWNAHASGGRERWARSAEKGFYISSYDGQGLHLQHEAVPRMFGWEFDGRWKNLVPDGLVQDLDHLLPTERDYQRSSRPISKERSAKSSRWS